MLFVRHTGTTFIRNLLHQSIVRFCQITLTDQTTWHHMPANHDTKIKMTGKLHACRTRRVHFVWREPAKWTYRSWIFPTFKKHQINVLKGKPTKLLTIILQVCRWVLSPQAIYLYKQAPLIWRLHHLACGGLDPETCLFFWPYTIITTDEG